MQNGLYDCYDFITRPARLNKTEAKQIATLWFNVLKFSLSLHGCPFAYIVLLNIENAIRQCVRVSDFRAIFLSKMSNKQEFIQSYHNAQQLNLIKDEIDFCV